MKQYEKKYTDDQLDSEVPLETLLYHEAICKWLWLHDNDNMTNIVHPN